jgi:hypothetical protein
MPKTTLTTDQMTSLAEAHFALAAHHRQLAQEYATWDSRRAMLMRMAGDVDALGMAWLELCNPVRIAA